MTQSAKFVLVFALGFVTTASPAIAQMKLDGWKILACTSDAPLNFMREPMTVFFQDAGKFREAGGDEVTGGDVRIDKAEIFAKSRHWTWTISRVTGRFSHERYDNEGHTVLRVTGSCIQAQKAKF
jgi:hypothetical protein